MALVLATDDSPASLIGVFHGFVAMWNDLDTIEGFFRTGGGMSWGDHHPALNDAQARFTRPMYRAALVDGWIAALDGVTGRAAGRWHGRRHRLRPGHLDDHDGRTVPGLVVHRLRPQRRGDRRGPQGGRRRRLWPTGSASRSPTRPSFPADHGQGYDLVCFTDSLHDLGDPVAAARARPLGPGARRDRDGGRAARRRPVSRTTSPTRTPASATPSRRWCARPPRSPSPARRRSGPWRARPGSARCWPTLATPGCAGRPPRPRRSTSCWRSAHDR